MIIRRGAFGAPLDAILGADANVRLLRQLSSRPGAYVTPGALAERTGLTRAAVYRALERLFDTGIVEYDSSPNQRCRLRAEHPLADALTALYRVEADRIGEVMESLRSGIETLSPPPVSAWIEGPVTRGEDEFGDPVVLGLLDTPEHVREHTDSLQEALVDLQRRQDVTVEIRGYTRADLVSLSPDALESLSGAVPVFGTPVEPLIAPEKYRQTSPPRSHEDHETRSRALGAALSRRVRTDPELIDRARDWISMRIERASEPEISTLREWDRILRSMSPARLGRFLVADSERAIRLRQTNPLVGALSRSERDELLEGRTE